MPTYTNNSPLGFTTHPLPIDSNVSSPPPAHSYQNSFFQPVTYPVVLPSSSLSVTSVKIEKVYIHDFITTKAKGCSVSHSGFQALITLLTFQIFVMTGTLPIVSHLTAAIFGHACISFQNSGKEISTYRKIQSYLNQVKTLQKKDKIELSKENVEYVSEIINKNNSKDFNSQSPYEAFKSFLRQANEDICDEQGNYKRMQLIY